MYILTAIGLAHVLVDGLHFTYVVRNIKKNGSLSLYRGDKRPSRHALYAKDEQLEKQDCTFSNFRNYG